MANSLQICRICLSVNTRLFTLRNTNLQNLYKLLTKVYVNSEDGKPATVCYLCYARLRQCQRLQQQAIKSNVLLEQLLRGGIMQDITNANLNNLNTSQDLQMSSIYHLDLEPLTCRDVLLDPNNELYSHITVKVEEVVTDDIIINLDSDSSQDANDNDFVPEAISSVSENDQLLIANSSNKCNGVKDIAHGLERNKRQKKEGAKDETGPNGFAAEANCSDSVDVQSSISKVSNKCDGIEDIVHSFEQGKLQQKENLGKGSLVSDHQLTKAEMLNLSLSEMYICDICTFKTYKKHSIETHLKMHTNTKFFSCNICEYRCAHNSHFKRHMRKHTGEKPFSCDICQYRCAHKGDIKSHMRVHTGEKPFSCNICEYRFAHKCHLINHMRTHTGEKPFACKICEHRFAQKGDLIKHMRTHTGERPFACNICEYKCTVKSNLKDHMKTHTGEKPFACNICEYRCAHKSDLKRHMGRTHTGKKLFMCNICEYKCTYKDDLKDHKKTHPEEKPFACNICKYRCAHKSGLKNHFRIHTGEKPFACNICEYKCTYKHNLKDHIRTHTGEKPFACNICEYTCIQMSCLKQHLRKHI